MHAEDQSAARLERGGATGEQSGLFRGLEILKYIHDENEPRAAEFEVAHIGDAD